LNEGMANTLLEAMACGLPSVVTDVSGMDQLVRRPQTGLVVPTDSPEALASALQSLHADPERRRQMGERARDLILQRYAIARVADEHRQLYGSILDRTARA
jgi:glycosyltransferase involved in cell wall biosynthesis